MKKKAIKILHFCAKSSRFLLADYFTGIVLHSRRRKFAFTLAEVLITLGIIGIVAAMTIPALVESHENSELQSRLKKSYSLMAQVTERVVQEENGGDTPIPLSGDELNLIKGYEKYIVKSDSCFRDSSICNTAIFPVKNWDYAVLGGWYFYKCYKNVHYLMDDGMMALNDGSFVYFDYGNSMGKIGNYLLSIDINGWRKKPNKAGIDLFLFQLTKNGHLTPMGADGTFFQNNDCYNNPNEYCTYTALGDSDYFKKVKK